MEVTIRSGFAAIGLTALLVTGAGCENSAPDEVVAPYVPPPCASTYNTAVDACVVASGCAGFECFFVLEQCSADAKRGPLMECCVANYQTVDDRQQCIDSLGQGP